MSRDRLLSISDTYGSLPGECSVQPYTRPFDLVLISSFRDTFLLSLYIVFVLTTSLSLLFCSKNKLDNTGPLTLTDMLNSIYHAFPFRVLHAGHFMTEANFTGSG